MAKKEKSNLIWLRTYSLILLWPLLYLLLFYLRGVDLTYLDYLKIFLSSFLFFIIPGNLILNLIYQEKDFLKNLTLSLIIGVVLSLYLFSLISLLNIGHYFVLIMTIISVLSVLSRRLSIGNFRSIKYYWGLFLIFGFFLFLLYWSHQIKIQVLDDGSLKLFSQGDQLFHNGVVQSLNKTFPPYLHYFSGFGHYDYHFGLDIFVNIISKLTGINVIIILAKYLIPSLLFLLILTSYYFANQLLANRNYAILFTILIFASDLSYFIPYCIKTSIWSNCFNTPTIFSLVFLNPQLLALVFFFAFLYFFVRWIQNGKNKFPFFLFFIPAIIETKSFLGVQLVISMSIVLFNSLLKQKNRQSWITLILFGLLLIPSAAKSIILHGKSGYFFEFVPLHNYKEILTKIRFENINLWLFLLVTLVIFTLQLGPRILFFIRMTRAKFHPMINIFLVSFIVSGIILTLLFKYVSQGNNYNNMVWFMVNSLLVMWIYVVEFIQNSARKKVLKIFMIILFIVVSYPSTLEYFYNFNRLGKGYNQPTIVKKNYLEAGDFIDKNSHKDDVFIEKPQQDTGYSVSDNFGGAQNVLTGSTTYIESFVDSGTDDYNKNLRKHDIDSFFEFKNTTLMEEIIDKYKVTFILDYNNSDHNREKILKELKFNRVFENNSLSIYKNEF